MCQVTREDGCSKEHVWWGGRGELMACLLKVEDLPIFLLRVQACLQRPNAGRGILEPALCSCCPGTIHAVQGEYPVPGGMLLPAEGAAGVGGQEGSFWGALKPLEIFPHGGSSRTRKDISLSLLSGYFLSLKLWDGFSLLSVSYCFASLEMGPTGAVMKALCHI